MNNQLPPNQGVEQQIRITEDDIIRCKDHPGCTGECFMPTIRVARISPLVSPTGKEELVPANDSLFCIKCGRTIGEVIQSNIKNGIVGSQFNNQEHPQNTEKVAPIFKEDNEPEESTNTYPPQTNNIINILPGNDTPQ